MEVLENEIISNLVRGWQDRAGCQAKLRGPGEFMLGTKAVAQTAPKVGEPGGRTLNMAKEVTHMLASSSGGNGVVGGPGQRIPMEVVKEDFGKECPRGRPVIAMAGGQAGQETVQEAKTSANQHRPRD